MPRLRRRGVVGEVGEEKKTFSTELELPSASPTKNAARTAKGPIPKTQTNTINGSSENQVEATTPIGVVKKKPPTPPQAKVTKGGIQKSFRDRLQWRSTHCVMPPTSTPIRDPRQKFTKEDIETAFGFDEDVEKTEYSTLVSPIAHASPKGINAPVWKIHPLSQRNVECGVPKSRNPRLAAPPPSTSRTRHPSLKRSSSEEAKGSPRLKVGRRPALVAPPVSPKSQPQIPPPTPPKVVNEKKRVELEVTPKPIMGDIELPSIIEVTPPASSSSHSVVPSSSSEPSQTKATEDAAGPVVKQKEEQIASAAAAAAVPLRRGRPKKKVVCTEEKSEVEELKPVPKSMPVATRSRKRRPPSPPCEQKKSKEEEVVEELIEPTKRPSRPTRSQKTANGTSAVSQTALKPKKTVKTKVTRKEREPQVEIEEIEADDEKEKHEVILEAAPVGKAKRKRVAEEAKIKKKVKSRTTKSTALTIDPGKRPLLFENFTRQEEQATGISPFSQLVSRYKEEEMDEDGELRVDPRKIVRTYTSRKRAKYSEERDSEAEYDFIPKPTTSSAVAQQDELKIKKKSKKGVKVKGRKKKDGDEDLDEETRKWLEQKNKEFEDVAKVKLVIEQSFSD